MADRSQNILINYKFNTSEIEKANAILNRANDSTNKLQNEAQKSGQKINQSFSGARQSIAAMNTQLDLLKTRISISSDPKQVAQLSAQYKALKTQIDAATKSAFQLPKALNETKAATQSLSQQFGQFYTAAKLLVTAGIAREIVNIGLEMATLSGRVEGVEAAFKRTIPNEVFFLNQLREATHGTLTDFELMQKSLKAENLGVPVEKLGVLLEFAATRAQQTGDSVDYLVNSIIDGLGRKSILKLDNLGVSATRLKDAMGGISTQAATVEQVTAAFTKVAQEELQKMGGYAETSATKVEQLKVAAEQLRITLSKKLTSGFLVDIATAGIKNAEAGIKVLTDGVVQASLDIHQQIIKDAASEKAALALQSQAYQDLGKDITAKIEFIKKEIATTKQIADVRKGDIQQTEQSIETTKKQLYAESLIGLQTGKSIRETEKATGVLKQRVDQQVRSREILLATIPILKEYIKDLQQQNEVEAVKPSGIVSRLKDEIAALQDAIELTNKQSDLGAGGELTKALELAQARLGDLTRAFRTFHIQEFKTEIKDATKETGFLADAMQGVAVRLETSMAELANLKLPLPPSIIPNDFWDDLETEWEENWRDILARGVDLQADIINMELQADLDNYKRRLKATKDFYDQQQLLAGDNEKARSVLRLREEKQTAELQRRIFEKEKQTRRAQAIIDGAAAVVKAFVTAPNFAVALIQSAFIAAQTIAQVRNINRQRSGFFKGVIDLQGPGTATSDSIPANLSKGESVMTAWETKHAGNVLRDIRAKKLDDKVLKDLKRDRSPVQQQQFNDDRIIKAIEKNRPPDVIEQSGIAYEVKQKGDNYRLKVRAKSGRFRL